MTHNYDEDHEPYNAEFQLFNKVSEEFLKQHLERVPFQFVIGVKSFDQLVEFYNKTNLKFDIDKAEQTIYLNAERSSEDIIDKIKLVFSNDGLKIAYLPNEDNNAN